jgi:hypothetical protein
MNEAGKAMVVIFPAGKYSPVFVQPCEQALDLPSPFVPTQDTAILGGRSDAPLPVRRDQLNVIGGDGSLS